MMIVLIGVWNVVSLREEVIEEGISLGESNIFSVVHGIGRWCLFGFYTIDSLLLLGDLADIFVQMHCKPTLI
jgi:hypothetical protein